MRHPETKEIVSKAVDAVVVCILIPVMVGYRKFYFDLILVNMRLIG